jgi:O-antigen/teichoic acid export membrane protein
VGKPISPFPPTAKKPNEMNQIRRLYLWSRAHPARAAVLAGWFQQGGTTLGAIISIPFVLRMLGQTDAGLWFSLQGFLTMLGLADFGFSLAISRQAAHSLYLVSGNSPLGDRPDLIETEPGWAGVSELYGASRVLFWRVTAAAAVVLIVLYHAVIPFTRLIENHSLNTALTYYSLGISVLLTLQARLALAFLDGIGFMFLSRLISGAYGLLWNVASVIALLIAPGLLSMSLAVLACSILQYAAMHFALAGVADRQLNFKTPASKPMVSRLWRVALPFGVVNSGVYLVGAVQVPLLGAILGAAAVAPYYLAARISQTFHGAVQQITLTQMPLFTQQLAAGHVPEARQRMIRTLRLGVALYVATGLFLYFASPAVVRVWVGPGQYVTLGVLLLVTINFLVAGVTAVPGHFVLAAGSNPFAVPTLIQGVLTVLGVIAFCPWIGIAGVPLSSLLAGLCTSYWYNPFKAVQLWRHMHMASQAAAPHATVEPGVASTR